MIHSQPLQHAPVRFAGPADHGTFRGAAKPEGFGAGSGTPASTAAPVPSGVSAFILRLSALCKLSAEEIHLLQGLGRFVRSHLSNTEIAVDGAPMSARVVVSGWACQQRMLGDGRRQIISLLLPGDVIGSLDQPKLPSKDSFVALTPLVTAEASALVKAVASGDPAYRGLARAVRLLTQQEIAMMRDQIVRLGRQTAYERMTHLMLELHARLQLVGIAGNNAFPMPLTQETLGDVLGLSAVHTNRVMQQMRRDGLLETRSGQVKILDLKAMRTVADWLPTLH